MHQPPDTGRSGEGDPVDIGRKRQRPARHRAATRHHVQHALRPARLKEKLAKHQRAERGVFGRFQHHAVARRKGRRNLPDRHHQRIVPGRDTADDTQRLTQDVMQRAVIGDGAGAADLVGSLGHVAQGQHGTGHVDRQHLRNRLAHFQRIERGKKVAVRLDQIGKTRQNPDPASQRHTRPDALVEPLAGNTGRAFDIVGRSAG